MPPRNDQLNSPALRSIGHWLWLAGVVVLVLVITVLSTAVLVDQAVQGSSRLTGSQREMTLKLVRFPKQVAIAGFQIATMLGAKPYFLLISKEMPEEKRWKRIFPMPTDTGYLLLSAVNSVDKVSVVKLIRISDGREMVNWVPDWGEIIDKSKSSSRFATGVREQNVRAFHPLLLPDGDLIFNTGISLIRMSTCTQEPVWVLNEMAHHSNELDKQFNIWVPSVAVDYFRTNPWLKEKLRDDALMQVSPDGRVLQKISFSKVLMTNGLSALLLGTQGLNFNEDPIHLNQITIAQNTTAYWQEGDLLVSARHLSTVFLYRPSTGKIIWHKTGPWLNQHSVYFLGDHQISIFDNNVFGGAPQQQPFVNPGDINRVMIYDFKTDQITEPYEKLLSEEKPITMTEGRAQILPDGGLFIEETNFGRHLRFTKDKLLWSRVNDYDDKHIGSVAWSRYLTKEEAEAPLRAIAAKKCAVHP